MNTFVISYDLNRPGQKYDDLYESIKKIGSWWHCLDSTWIVKSNLSSSQVRDELSSKLDSNDRLLVAKLTGEAAWVGFGQECSDWLKKNL